MLPGFGGPARLFVQQVVQRGLGALAPALALRPLELDGTLVRRPERIGWKGVGHRRLLRCKWKPVGPRLRVLPARSTRGAGQGMKLLYALARAVLRQSE
jgi:hypothetical protein